MFNLHGSWVGFKLDIILDEGGELTAWHPTQGFSLHHWPGCLPKMKYIMNYSTRYQVLLAARLTQETILLPERKEAVILCDTTH